ncbi:MAG: universal stress protein, partial [Rhizobacter sp.]|nr:universal stress protein [Rhizobacter sp.]
MSPLRSILVHVDDMAHTSARLRIANRLAEQHDAQVTALYVAMPPFMQFSMTYASGADVVPIMQDYEAQRRQRARALFDETVAVGMPRVRWVEVSGEPTWVMSRHALLADLLVLGQRDTKTERDSGLPFDFVESVLLASGKPALVIPTIRVVEPVGRIALVAWKETREAGRALAAAMPLLQRAEKVHVAIWDDSSLQQAGEAPLDIAQALREHGVPAEVHHHGPAARAAGAFLLSRATDLGAGLLGMGCYGHGRARA